MTARPILQVPDERLRSRCAPVHEWSQALRELCADLVATRERAEGSGLAAPQVGELVRVISVNPGQVCGFRVMINPEIVKHGNNKQWGEEGCLSIDGGRRKFRVRRWETITVRFQDVEGAEHERLLRGYAARVVQHEVDHLDGILVDRRAGKAAVK